RTVSALEELRELSRKHKFKLAIGRQGTLMKPKLTDEEVTRMWRLFRWKCKGKCIAWESFLEARRCVVEAQDRFAKKHGLPHIDTEAWLPKTMEYFVDDVHTLENGADKISDSFADGLVKSGVLQELLAQRKPTEQARARAR